MDGADFRQQQELEEERQAEIMSVLSRIEERCGSEVAKAAAFHMGYSSEWLKHISREKETA